MKLGSLTSACLRLRTVRLEILNVEEAHLVKGTVFICSRKLDDVNLQDHHLCLDHRECVRVLGDSMIASGQVLQS